MKLYLAPVLWRDLYDDDDRYVREKAPAMSRRFYGNGYYRWRRVVRVAGPIWRSTSAEFVDHECNFAAAAA